MFAVCCTDLLSSIDYRDVAAPVRDCLDQSVFAAEEGDFIMMGVLAKHCRDVARTLGNRPGEGASTIHHGLAHVGLRRFSAGEDLFSAGRAVLESDSHNSSRKNEAIATICLGLRFELEQRACPFGSAKIPQRAQALGYYENALGQLDIARRAYAEMGDRSECADVAFLRDWVAQKATALRPAVFVDVTERHVWNSSGGRLPGRLGGDL